MADRQFTAEKAAKELEAYHKGRLAPTTRLLREAIVEAGLTRGSLLDVGAGIGALTFELLGRGVTRAVVAEASAAYVSVIGDEARRRGHTTAVDVVHGDLLDVSESLPSADLVTLDRVICCYPLFQPMLEAAVRRATRGFAFSYPKDRWFVRVAVGLENAMRRRQTGFRMFVHPPAGMRGIVERAGFVLASRRETAMWSVDFYLKGQASAG